MRRSEHQESLARLIAQFDAKIFDIIEKRACCGHTFRALSRTQITREHMRIARSKKDVHDVHGVRDWPEHYGAIGRSIQRLRKAQKIKTEYLHNHWIVNKTEAK